MAGADPEPRRGNAPARGRAWWIAALVLISAWCLYLYFFGPRAPMEAPTLEERPTGVQADFDWTLHDLGGREVPLARYRGRAIFLNLWATWCPPCVAELPSIANLARSPRLKDVAFLCVSCDDDPAEVRRFLEGKGWPLTVLHATEVPPAFSSPGIPATYLIAPDGRVAASWIGAARWDDPGVVEFLEKLAAPQPKPEGAPAPERP